MPNITTDTSGNITIGANCAINNSIIFDNNDYITYDRTNNAYRVYIGGVEKVTFNSTGIAGDGSQLVKVTKPLASDTISAQPQLDLVLSSYIAAGYTEFELRISNLVAATNNTILTLVVSTDGGSTYQTSGYKGGGNTLLSGSTASFAVGGSGQSLARLSVFDVVGNATAKAATGVIRLFCKPQRFSLVTESGSENPSSNEFINTKLFGWGDQTNVNAIRLQFATGNITSLTYSLIGVA